MPADGRRSPEPHQRGHPRSARLRQGGTREAGLPAKEEQSMVGLLPRVLALREAVVCGGPALTCASRSRPEGPAFVRPLLPGPS
jgi:hypothetical protein